jgi:hypothetical protein
MNLLGGTLPHLALELILLEIGMVFLFIVFVEGLVWPPLFCIPLFFIIYSGLCKKKKSIITIDKNAFTVNQ